MQLPYWPISGSRRKKMVSASVRQQQVAFVCQRGRSVRRACALSPLRSAVVANNFAATCIAGLGLGVSVHLKSVREYFCPKSHQDISRLLEAENARLSV
jgi:hypothetical protein